MKQLEQLTQAIVVKLLFIFKARKQAHSERCNCFRNTEDEQKDKSIVQVISCMFLSYWVRSDNDRFETSQTTVSVLLIHLYGVAV